MTRRHHRCPCWLQGESGQVLPFFLATLVVLLGMVGLAVDVGHAFYCHRALQQVADAAALAGAGSMRTAADSASAVAKANALSATAGSVNATTSLPSVTMVSGYPLLECLSTLQSQGMACVGNIPYNAIQVQEQSVVPMYFSALFGMKTMTITVISTASVRGGAPSPYNVAVLIDTSLSMLFPDADCGATEIGCAMQGVQILLQSLTPCAIGLANCTITAGIAASSVDRVALFTFPDVSTATSSRDTSCTTAVPAPSSGNRYWSMAQNGAAINFVMPMSPTGVTPVTPWSSLAQSMAYSFPTRGAVSYLPAQSNFATYPMTTGTATYQITEFLSDYRISSKAASLNANSSLVQAVGGVLGCGSMTTPNYGGVFGTYYAAAIYAAQSALTAEQGANPGSGNVLIIVGDGDNTAPNANGANVVMGPGATGNGQYPSWNGECGQAVVAAQFATSQGTLVYSVAYGAASAGCSSDLAAGSYPNITPCTTMQKLASAPQYFYSDYKKSGSGSTCVSGQPVTSLSAIFSSIAGGLTTARLIPNGTQ